MGYYDVLFTHTGSENMAQKTVSLIWFEHDSGYLYNRYAVEVIDDLGRNIVMAIAKKCDVCGTYYEPYNIKCSSERVNGLMFLNIDTSQKYFSHNTIDCCPKCMETIKRHIRSLQVKETKNDQD